MARKKTVKPEADKMVRDDFETAERQEPKYVQRKVVCGHVAPLLNVRETPDGDVIKTVKDGSRIYVGEEADGWYPVKSGGYVKAEFIG